MGVAFIGAAAGSAWIQLYLSQCQRGSSCTGVRPQVQRGSNCTGRNVNVDLAAPASGRRSAWIQLYRPQYQPGSNCTDHSQRGSNCTGRSVSADSAVPVAYGYLCVVPRPSRKRRPGNAAEVWCCSSNFCMLPVPADMYKWIELDTEGTQGVGMADAIDDKVSTAMYCI